MAVSGHKETEMNISGMHCASCVARVEGAIASVPGVESVNVNLATKTAQIHGHADPSHVARAVQRVGYDASMADEMDHDDHQHAHYADMKTLRINFFGAAVLTIPVFLGSMFWHPRPEWANYVLAILTTPVIFWFGREFFMRALKSARFGHANMDTLVALGSASAWLISVIALFRFQGHGHHQSEQIYFETGAVIVTLILFGRFLEGRAMHQMTGAIRALMDLAPAKAIRLSEGTEPEEISAKQIQVGDVLLVKPGATIPTDGTVIEGESFVVEAMITGEPEPQKKGAGDSLTGGTQNESGALTMRADRVGGDTVLSQIASQVKRAQGSKAPMQRMADRISSIFVPIVIAIALLTAFASPAFGISWDISLLRAIAVLVVACPCALGLATPTALMAGVGRGSELGILIKDGLALERAAHLHTVVLDKTGTLTDGRPQLIGVATEGWTETEAIQTAAALESRSEHPIARAIVSRAEASLPEVSDFSAVRGSGVQGRVAGEPTAIGRVSWIAEMGGSLSSELSARAEAWAEQGATVFAMGQGDRRAVFAVQDPISDTAQPALSTLSEQGLQITLATGDQASAAKKLATTLGIQDVHAAMSPGGKAELVQELQKQGPVAMVGDGINDAPALAQADLSIAMGHGTNVAMETAGVTLLQADLRGVSTTVALARKTLSIIKGNLFWAFAYNVVMIPLAITGVINPMIASGAMALSSVSVVANSLRLKRFAK
ncbi:MAG: copper-translocating P-type ATPase [Fimbriimonadaceae bacterium]|nr:copper-translocating P-type ATPase [Fimbriimonadaceae bacterium]